MQSRPRLSCTCFIVGLLAAILIAVASAQAAQAQNICPEGGPIVIGTREQGWPPYHLPKGHPAGNGIMPDIFIEAATALGCEVRRSFLPEKRVFIEMKRAEVDVFTKAREWLPEPDAYLWSKPILYSTDKLMFRKGKTFSFHGRDTLRGKRLGTMHSYEYPFLEPLFRLGTVYREDAQDPESMIRMLQKGYTDAAVITRAAALWTFSRQPDLDAASFCYAERPMATAGYRFMFGMHRAWGRFIYRLDEEFIRMQEDGRLDAIMGKYR